MAPKPNLSGTPPREHSSQVQGSSTIDQETLKKRMGKELSNQVWKFPVDRIADMLPPSGVPSPSNSQIRRAANDLKNKVTPAHRAALKSAVERQTYDSLVAVLNSCVESCTSASSNKAGNRWFSGLEFIVYDKLMGDEVDGAKKLKPDVACRRDKSTQRTQAQCHALLENLRRRCQ